MKNSKGFTIIEGLLIMVILGILGGTGWYVWSSHNKTTDTLNNADSANSSVADYSKSKSNSKSTTDPTTGWTAYSNKDGDYSLKYPKTWITASHPELCNPELLLLGADSKSVGVCASEGFGLITVASEKGDTSSANDLTKSCSDVTKEKVTAGGIEGTRQSVTVSANQQGTQANCASLGYDDGTKLVLYVFYTGGRTYTARYAQTPSYPDVLSDFDLMVTKTLKFSS
jgi:type II secretory pathway pseudopilin PulG